MRGALHDPRVRVLRHAANQGVGGAVMTGYRAGGRRRARRHRQDRRRRPDGSCAAPGASSSRSCAARRTTRRAIASSTSTDRAGMPTVRSSATPCCLHDQAVDRLLEHLRPTNGYTAIHARVLPPLPLEKIAKRYFFETDMLFRLNTMQAVVVDMPMEAVYADEKSNLRISRRCPNSSGGTSGTREAHRSTATSCATSRSPR